MKLLVSLNRKEVKDYLDYTNSFIIGLKDYSINYIEFTLEDIEKLLSNNHNIELFVSINKNIFNAELKDLEDDLIKLSKLNIKGVLFYDLSILAIVKRLNLNLSLVWHQTHMVTNYNTCNYYYDKGVEYAYLASEITYQEMIEIKEKSKISLMALIMGHPIVSHSRRHLLTSYFENYHRHMEKDTYKIIGKNKEDVGEYFIREKDHGTSILYGNILNGTKYLKLLENTLDYAILDEQLIDHDLFIKVLSLCKELLDGRDVLEKIKELIGEDTLFFERKTIYKVKKNEKD